LGRSARLSAGHYMQGSSFYTPDELAQLGLLAFGSNVLVSRYARIYCPNRLSLGHDVRIDDFCLISAGKGVTIGSYVHIAAYSAIYGGGGVTMEDLSVLSSRVVVYSETDDFSGESLTTPMVPQEFRRFMVCKPVHIGKHVAIGTSSTIMPGITIGEGAAVGAHSFVRSDCMPWYIYLGTPARRLRARSRDVLRLEHALLAGQNASDTTSTNWRDSEGSR